MMARQTRHGRGANARHVLWRTASHAMSRCSARSLNPEGPAAFSLSREGTRRVRTGIFKDLRPDERAGVLAACLQSDVAAGGGR